MNGQNKKIANIFWLGVVFPIAALISSICIGRYPIGINQLIAYLFSPGVFEDPGANIFWNIRLPRVLFSMMAGGALSISGSVLQGVYRNPLVSPDIIGVSSGASLGAAISIVLFSSASSTVQLFAFAGGIIAVLFTFNLARLGNQSTIVSLILSGVIINALAQSGVSILKYMADPLQQLPALEFWLMGSLNTITWEKLINFLPMFFIGSVIIILLRWQLNALSMGDEEAASLGVSVVITRGIMIAMATVLVSGVVSMTGMIAWVGLICPHITRILTGSDHRVSVPVSFFTGAGFMAISDTVARSLTAAELPISVITAFTGAPFLAYLLIKSGKSAWQ
ncbi:MAG: iron ABC transporter permease [Lachnospiraceae bacterium]|jgi:iron complex transport system permease protein|nr:iron ABC transporter permease [Lachnospiraceae bacterium]